MPEKLITNRLQRQNIAAAWALRCFGHAESKSTEQRALRLLEEAIELAQAAGVDPVVAKSLLDYVYSKPPGLLDQELGGVGVCVLAFADAAGVDADTIEDIELQRLLAKPEEFFRARNELKNQLGFHARRPRYCGCPCHSGQAKHVYACCGPGSLRPDLTPPEEEGTSGDRAE